MKINGLVYRIRYHELDEIKTIHVRYISEESLVGFLEADELILNNDAGIENSEASLEFNGVQRIYLPLQVILRIDEIDLGAHLSNVESIKNTKGNVSRFPSDSATKNKE